MTAPGRIVRVVRPGSFVASEHYYPRVLDGQLHPMVRFFLGLDAQRIVARYSHLEPGIDARALEEVIVHQAKTFPWAGCDLMHVATEGGRRHMVVIETNSCPSGQKSMPLYDEHDDQGGYRALVDHVFLPTLAERPLPSGALAVLFDKNDMEASGYAAVLADRTGESVFLVPFHETEPDPPARFDDGVLEVRDDTGRWWPVRAALRYVTQRPWSRIPVGTRTLVFNPVVACLAGGRNKAVAAKAYAAFNRDMKGTGLHIRTPATAWDVSLPEIPARVAAMGGRAVVKVPYSNAGQGVFTIANEAELAAFMQTPHAYGRFVVQNLIANSGWGSEVSGSERLFHVGTFPDEDGETYATDLRVMVASGPTGFRPLAIYARRARVPLSDLPPTGIESWDMLGTNLSIKLAEGGWQTDQVRLVTMDRMDFHTLGLGVDDLIEAYVQTVLATVAIDRMASSLMDQRGRLRSSRFRQLNDDAALIDELLS